MTLDPPGGPVPGVQTSAAPTLTTYQGSLYLFYRGAEDDLIRCTTWGDSGAWSSPVALPGNVNTSDAPLACNLGNLFVVYKGVPGDPRIYRVASSDGTNWSVTEPLDSSADPQCTTSIGTGLAPGAGIFPAGFHVLFQAAGQSAIYDTQSADLETWSCPLALPYSTSAAPGVASSLEALYLFFKGANDQRIYQAALSGSGWPAEPEVLPDSIMTSDSPCPVMFNGLKVFYKGVTGDSTIWYASAVDGAWITTQLPTGINTDTSPRVAMFNGSLVLAYKGVDGDPSVYVEPLPTLF